MINDNAKKWLAALRSGEYQQGRGALCRADRFCCLGVACAVYQKDVGDLKVKDVANMTEFDGETGVLPKRMQAWLGINDENPDLYDGQRERPMASRNDSGATFADLANLIEQNESRVFA